MRKTLIVLATLAAILGFMLVPGGAVEPASADHQCIESECLVPWPHDLLCLPSPDPHKHQTCIA